MTEDGRILLWRVHAGFVQYVARLPDGEVAVRRGAGVTADGELAFRGTRRLRFVGEASFTGHLGLLALTLADPAIEEAARDTVLTWRDGTGRRQPVARLEPLREPHSWSTALHPAAIGLFGGNYAPGTPFAEVRVVEHCDAQWSPPSSLQSLT